MQVSKTAQFASDLADWSSLTALRPMHSEGGKPLLGHPVNVVFIGSWTNGRLADLRNAASVLTGRQVSPKVRVLVVAGLQQVKREAEAEGLDAIIRAAGPGRAHRPGQPADRRGLRGHRRDH